MSSLLLRPALAALAVLAPIIAVTVVYGGHLAIDRFRFRRRREQRTARILNALQAIPGRRLAGLELSRIAFVGVGSLHSILARLETDQVIGSEWGDGPYPRLRYYYWPATSETAVA